MSLTLAVSIHCNVADCGGGGPGGLGHETIDAQTYAGASLSAWDRTCMGLAVHWCEQRPHACLDEASEVSGTRFYVLPL